MLVRYSDYSCCYKRDGITNQHKDKRYITLLICVLFLIVVFSGVVWGKYGGGSGRPDDPFLIYTPNDLSLIGNDSNDWGKNFKLMADVDMNDFNGIDGHPSFPIIGYLNWEPYESMPFKGVFDGNNKKILNLTITSVGRDFVGLFGYINAPIACVKNLTIVNPYINSSTKMYVGAVAGKLKNGTISNCVVDGGDVYGGYNVGGLVGCVVKGIIKNCTVNANIIGNADVGGVVGYNLGAEITRCRFSGYVHGMQDVGGLAGECDGRISYCGMNGTVSGFRDKAAGLVGTLRGELKASFAKGQITGGDEVGGLVGRNSGYIEDCYASGSVSGNNYIGGLTGFIYDGGSVSRCYAGCDVNAAVNEAEQLFGWAQINSVTASFWPTDDASKNQMMLLQTYLDAGWDFVGESGNGFLDTWVICDGIGFPRLSWESRLTGDFECPEGVDIYDITYLCDYWLLNKNSVDTSGRLIAGGFNFIDWAQFAKTWHTASGSPNFNAQYDVAPAGGNGVIDIDDLMAFSQNWLATGPDYPDIAPLTPDGIVNFLDFALVANNFLNQN